MPMGECRARRSDVPVEHHLDVGAPATELLERQEPKRHGPPGGDDSRVEHDLVGAPRRVAPGVERVIDREVEMTGARRVALAQQVREPRARSDAVQTTTVGVTRPERLRRGGVEVRLVVLNEVGTCRRRPRAARSAQPSASRSRGRCRRPPTRRSCCGAEAFEPEVLVEAALGLGLRLAAMTPLRVLSHREHRCPRSRSASSSRTIVAWPPLPRLKSGITTARCHGPSMEARVGASGAGPLRASSTRASHDRASPGGSRWSPKATPDRREPHPSEPRRRR